jgi:hypothetical protein
VVAQCETELLQLDDFEDLITHLKVLHFFVLRQSTAHTAKLRLHSKIAALA